MYIKIGSDNKNSLEVFCNTYNKHVIAAIKKVPYRKWDAERRLWLVPDTPLSSQKLLSALYESGLFNIQAQKPKEETVSENSDREILLNKLLEKNNTLLKANHYSQRTITAYQYWVRLFLEFNQDKNITRLNESDINKFLSNLASNNKVSSSTQNQAKAAILFFEKYSMYNPVGNLNSIITAKRSKKLPVVLSREELTLLFNDLNEIGRAHV